MSRKKTDTSHLVLVYTADDCHMFHCRHCDVQMRMQLPMSISDYVKRTKQFMKAHKHCLPPKE